MEKVRLERLLPHPETSAYERTKGNSKTIPRLITFPGSETISSESLEKKGGKNFLPS